MPMIDAAFLAAVRAAGIRGRTLDVLLYLLEIRVASGFSFVSQAKMATAIGAPEKSGDRMVRRELSKLEAVGFLAVHERPGRLTRYRVKRPGEPLLDDETDATPGPQPRTPESGVTSAPRTPESGVNGDNPGHQSPGLHQHPGHQSPPTPDTRVRGPRTPESGVAPATPLSARASEFRSDQSLNSETRAKEVDGRDGDVADHPPPRRTKAPHIAAFEASMRPRAAAPPTDGRWRPTPALVATWMAADVPTALGVTAWHSERQLLEAVDGMARTSALRGVADKIGDVVAFLAQFDDPERARRELGAVLRAWVEHPFAKQRDHHIATFDPVALYVPIQRERAARRGPVKAPSSPDERPATLEELKGPIADNLRAAGLIR